jgi:hypothetical protein
MPCCRLPLAVAHAGMIGGYRMGGNLRASAMRMGGYQRTMAEVSSMNALRVTPRKSLLLSGVACLCVAMEVAGTSFARVGAYRKRGRTLLREMCLSQHDSVQHSMFAPFLTTGTVPL